MVRCHYKIWLIMVLFPIATFYFCLKETKTRGPFRQKTSTRFYFIFDLGHKIAMIGAHKQLHKFYYATKITDNPNIAQNL